MEMGGGHDQHGPTAFLGIGLSVNYLVAGEIGYLVGSQAQKPTENVVVVLA